MNIEAVDDGVDFNVREEALYRKVLWRIVPIIFLCHIVSFLDRVNIGFAKLQMLGSLGITDSAYALGASVFFVGYIMFEVPSNYALHKVGARLWIARIMISWGIVSVGTMYTGNLAHLLGIQNSTMFYVMRFLLGCCEAGFYPGMLLYINYWFPSHRQSKVTSGLLLALPLSLVLGSPLSGWLMQSTQGFMGYSGWQWMLAIEGIPAIALAFLVYFGLTDKIADARWLSAAEKSTLIDNLDAEKPGKSYRFGAAVRDYRVWIVAGIIFTYATGFYGLSFWLPSIIRASGVQNTFYIGLLSAIPFVAAAATMLLNGWHSSKTQERRWHGAVPAFAGGAGLMLSAAFANNTPLAIFFLCVAASGVLGLTPIVWTYPGRLLTGTAAAAGFAMINSFGSLSGIAGSMITSLIKDLTGSINNGTYALGFIVMCTGVLILSIPASTFRRPHAAQGACAEESAAETFSDRLA